MRELDKEEGGIDDKCKAMNEIIKIVDPDVVKKLDGEGVTPQFYAIRWIMLLFCQEFDIYNTSVIWDALFADENRFQFLSFINASLVLTVRHEIINGEFAECMEALQTA